MSKVFNLVGVPKVGKSVFNLSYSKMFTGLIGLLYPSMVDEVVPGDRWSISKRIVCRLAPTIAPILDVLTLYEHTFFVPYRLLMNEDELGDAGDWEDFIIGGSDGDTDIALPTWNPTDYAPKSLWDYMGFPISVKPDSDNYPLDFPKRAYNLIANEYYYDIDIDTPVDITTSEAKLQRRWEKDYFTSARSDTQRGTSPAIPITGTLSVTGLDADIRFKNENDGVSRVAVEEASGNIASTSAPTGAGDLRWDTTSLVVDVSNAVTIDIADLRLLVQTQRWMERNMRAGVRYKEVIKAHFNQDIGDARLDRPEYIGGIKIQLITSEVLATTEGTSQVLGQMGGHGIGVGAKNIGTYRVKEYGLIMSILSVVPKPQYSQGIDRQWTRETLYDFYWPEFANLSEQAVLRKEIYANAVKADNETVFGYQGRYNEMRMKKNILCGRFGYNQTFNYWHFGREFDSAPSLNSTFLTVQAAAGSGGIRETDIFASGDTEDHLFINVGNIIKAVRPLPLIANPGFLDHN